MSLHTGLHPTLRIRISLLPGPHVLSLIIEMPPSLASDLGVPSIIQVVYTQISQKSRYHRNYELLLWLKEILAHPPTCAPL